MKTNSLKCYVFCFLFTAAHSKNRMQIETNWIERKTTENARFQERRRARERERARLCEWDASRMCTIQTSTRCNSEKLPDAMKSLWKNVQLSRSTTTKARTFKAAHAHSHSHPHIRTQIRTRCGARGPEGANKISVENHIDWASALPLYIAPSLPQVQLPQCARVEPTPARRNKGRQVAVAASLTSLQSSSTLCWG